MDYQEYEVEDFIADEYFQKWVLGTDSATNDFWINWLQNNADKKEVVEDATAFIQAMNFDKDLSKEEEDVMWNTILKKRNEPSLGGSKMPTPFFKRRTFQLVIAALFAGVFILVLGKDMIFSSSQLETPQVSKNEITLKLEDGTVKVLDENVSNTISSAQGTALVRQKKNLLIYANKKKNGEELRYNQLEVPYGKKFEIKLADGTHVFLNSGSKLRYPVNFKEEGTRSVFLDGEAYFYVQHDENNSFVVITEDMNIKVYGTKFNVSSYFNDNNTSTVLVEGSVGVYASENQESEITNIVPGERATISSGKIAVDKVDVNKYMAWTEGKLYFVDDQFQMILKQLERNFDVEFKNQLQELNNKRFTGTFTTESIEQILKIFQAHTPFEYELEGNLVHIYARPKKQSNIE